MSYFHCQCLPVERHGTERAFFFVPINVKYVISATSLREFIIPDILIHQGMLLNMAYGEAIEC